MAYISYPGEIFMRILKLMMLPLIFSSLIAGTSALNAKMSGRIALRTSIYFVATNLFNVIYGMTLALIVFRTADSHAATAEPSNADTASNGLRDSLMDLGRLVM